MGNGQNNQNWERQEFSLLELNNRVKEAVLNVLGACRDERRASECCIRALLSGVYREECDNRTTGGEGAWLYLGEDVPDVEALF